MPIKSFGQMAHTFKNYEAKNWSKNVDIGKSVDLKNDFPKLETNPDKTKSFGEFLADSVAQVNNLQHTAESAMQKLASGESKNLHETLLAVERADIAFKQMNQVRTKVIDVYKEIMRMQV